MIAAVAGRVLSLANLHSLGCDLLAKDDAKRTALHHAAKHNQCEILDAILGMLGEDRLAAALEARAADQSTAVHEAVSAGHLEATRLLLSRRKGLVEAEKRDGARPIHLAALLGRWDLIDMLASSPFECDVDASTSSGATALFIVSSQPVPQEHVVDGIHLLAGEFRADVDKSTQVGGPLHAAVLNNNADAVRAIIGYGANLNAITRDGESPIALASR